MNSIKVIREDTLLEMRASRSGFRVNLPRPHTSLGSCLSEQDRLKKMIRQGITLRPGPNQNASRAARHMIKTEPSPNQKDRSRFCTNNENSLRSSKRDGQRLEGVGQRRAKMKTEECGAEEIGEKMQEIFREIALESSLALKRTNKKLKEMSRAKFGKYWHQHFQLRRSRKRRES